MSLQPITSCQSRPHAHDYQGGSVGEVMEGETLPALSFLMRNGDGAPHDLTAALDAWRYLEQRIVPSLSSLTSAAPPSRRQS
ncbi:hypothetical protein O3P69_004601 [Scylla paramamosain]|uniref:Uncharacterized protein n=1 Tax=Scylla paramamosain TaxID=85552 RepID=A0AAW0UDL1_SCYPA